MISMNAGTSSQKLMLFRRGKAMSGAPIMIGTNQLPKPPIIAGMTMKKIMISPCAVTVAFQAWPSRKYCRPGFWLQFHAHRTEMHPDQPAHTAKIR